MNITDARSFGNDTSTINMWATYSSTNALTAIENNLSQDNGLALNLTRDFSLNSGYVGFYANNSATRSVIQLTGNISRSGGLLSSNGSFGMLILSGTNTYSGETRIFSGNLGFASDSNLGTAAAFDLGTNIAAAAPSLGIHLFGNWTTSKTYVNVEGNSSIDTGPFNAQLNGPMTTVGPATIVKFGTGTLAFTNAQNALGGLIIDNGTIQVSGNGQITQAAVNGMAVNSGRS